MLARELLNKPNGSYSFSVNEQEDEYIISGIQRKKTCANIDDSVMHWVLNLRDCGRGNVKR